MTVGKGEKYQYQEWPAMRYGPDGQTEVFNSEDEVPEGWVNHPSKLGKKASEKIREELDPMTNEGDDDEEPETIELDAKDIAEALSQDELIAKIDEVNEERAEDEQIEYAGNWSKVKLAQALIDAGVEVEIEEE